LAHRRMEGRTEERVSHYYHEVVGRLRVKHPVLKGDQIRCEEVQDFLARHLGVETVSANPVTGSVIVHYDPKVAHAEGIKALLAARGCFCPERAVTAGQHFDTSAERLGQLLGQALLNACLERVFGSSALSLITALL